MNTINTQASEVESAISAAEKFKAAHASLKARRDRLQDEARSIGERILTIQRLPLLRSEMKSLIFQHIDRLASKFPQDAKLGRIFESYVFPRGRGRGEGVHQGAFSLKDLDAATGFGAQSRLHNLFSGGLLMESTDDSGRVQEMEIMDARRLYFFFGDIIKGKIEAHFDQLFPDVVCGSTDADLSLSIEQKRAEIASLEAKGAELSRRAQEIDEQLNLLEEAGEVARNPMWRKC